MQLFTFIFVVLSSVELSMKAVIVGSGIGGLATALRLKKMGIDVLVIESNSFPGGKINSKWLGKYRFDTGPSVFTEPELMIELIEEENQNSFDFRQLDESCRYFFKDGFSVSLPVKRTGLVEVFVEKLGENKKDVIRFLDKMEKNYLAVKPVFIEVSLNRLKHVMNKNLVSAIRRIPFYGLFSTMHKENSKYFKNPKTIQILNRFATYNGSSPYKAPGLLNIISHLELNKGPGMPIGGMHQITKTIFEICESKGVKFNFGEKVLEITHHKNKIVGVKSNKSNYAADIVVSNMDVHYTYEKLLPQLIAPQRILKQEKSSSAIVFYWGIKGKRSELGVHNILFSENYSFEFDCLFETKTMTDDPTIYIHISSKVESQDAPNNCENWFVMVNAPINEGQDWDELVRLTRFRVINRINDTFKINLEQLIEEEEFMDPRRIDAEYFGKQGSIYGNSSNSRYAAFKRHPNFSTQLKGLYFTGVTVHPGGGIPLALNSAKIVERAIKEDYKIN